jgi:phage tail sheath protein FI
MAEVILSPGVFQQETDQSLFAVTPQVVGAALVGPTVFGSPFVPTYVTNYNQYKVLFGDIFKPSSSAYYLEYFTSLAAREYFANGGQTLLVTRIVSGSTTNFTTYATSSVTAYDTTDAFVLETRAWGDQMNNSGSEVSGALVSGSSYNVRWEVAYSDQNTGLFTVIVRRGDDNTTQKNVLETWSNLSLDPQLPNYVSRVIGDLKPIPNMTKGVVTFTGNYEGSSKYVRVKSVDHVMVDSLDNEGDFKTATYGTQMPATGSGSFSGGTTDGANPTRLMYENISATNIQGFNPVMYVTASRFLTDKDGYQFNMLLAPGVTLAHTAAANALITTVENRGDAIVVLDNGLYNTTITDAVTNTSNYLSNYAACYYPWVQVYSQNLGKAVWVPPSTVMGGVFMFNDLSSAEWFAPAGLNRGGIPSVIKAARLVKQTDRDTLYTARVNPLATFPGVGVAVWGQKTLQKKPTALDRVNVRRLMISLKQFIGGVARTLVFEQNTAVTRNRFLAQVNPYLASVVQRQGLYAYKVVMDDTNNTADVIDRNQLVGQIYVQPTKTAEYIILNFNILPTGATFPA